MAEDSLAREYAEQARAALGGALEKIGAEGQEVTDLAYKLGYAEQTIRQAVRLLGWTLDELTATCGTCGEPAVVRIDELPRCAACAIKTAEHLRDATAAQSLADWQEASL